MDPSHLVDNSHFPRKLRSHSIKSTGAEDGKDFSLFLKHRFHSISFTRAQGIPKYKIGFGKEKDGRVGEGLVEGVGIEGLGPVGD